MNAIDDLKRTTDLLTLAGRDTRLKRTGGGWYAGACPFCGGTDRFVLKQTADGWRWLCRHCTDGRYLDALDYVQRRRNCSLGEAMRELGGNSSLLWDDDLPPLKEPEPKTEPQEDKTQEFNTLTTEAGRRLDDQNDTIGARVRVYLNKRGLILPTWQRALLGACVAYDPKLKRKRIALLIPYFNTKLDVRAIKYRFVDDEPDGLRYMQNGVNDLYYLPDVLGYGDKLLICEGEINLLSLAQVQAVGVDLISTGSQSVTDNMKETLSKLARTGRYKTIYVWFDDQDKASEIAGMVRGRALRSPLVDGIKWDANRILQEDKLHAFIEKLMPGVKSLGWTLDGWRKQYGDLETH